MLANRIEEISEWRAVYPRRVKRGVISLTTIDWRKGLLGAFLSFSLYVCVCLGIWWDEG